MFNQCKVYKGSVALKMYPTWEKSNPAELHRIAKKFGKVYQSSISSKSLVHVKRKATEHLDLPPPKYCNLAVKAAPKPPRSPTRSKPRRRAKAVIKCVKFEEANDSEAHSDSGDSTDASFKNHNELEDRAPAVEPQNSKEFGCTILGAFFDEEDFYVVRHSRVSKLVIQPNTARSLLRKEL